MANKVALEVMMHAQRSMADDEYAAVLPAIVHRILPETPDTGVGTALYKLKRRR